MARIVCTAVLIVLLSTLVGCQSIDTGRGTLMPARTTTAITTAPTVDIVGASEADIVEHVAVNRQGYRQWLELLVEYYTKTGDNMKIKWAKKELDALNAMPQYQYIIEAFTAGPGLRARASIPEADAFYADTLQLEKSAALLPIFKNEDLLRVVRDKYNQLIRKYPSSNKIDDAAFQAAGIYEHFKDYTIALLYYQRAYQWDPDTIHPARFRAARILDQYLRRRAEALELYQEALREEAEFSEWKEFAEQRIKELTKSEKVEE
jgi:tetratricopeptide (TPR) repeat protein